MNGKDSYFANADVGKGYGVVEYGVYPGLDFDKMKEFADGNGAVMFGLEGDNTSCAKFANDCIRVGGGTMPDILAHIDENWKKWIGLKKAGYTKRQIALKGWVPSNLAKDIRERFPNVNSKHKSIISKNEN